MRIKTEAIIHLTSEQLMLKQYESWSKGACRIRSSHPRIGHHLHCKLPPNLTKGSFGSIKSWQERWISHGTNSEIIQRKNPIPEEKSAHGNNIAFVSALNKEISLLFLAEWWQVVRARRRSVCHRSLRAAMRETRGGLCCCCQRSERGNRATSRGVGGRRG